MALTINELTGKKIGVCVSGGLDSKTISMKMREMGCDVLCFTADLAQPDEDSIESVRAKMAPCGVETVIVDLKDAMAEACFEIIKYQATYDGGYWNTTGIARAVTVKGLLKEMQASGCEILSHGATGRGNDQVRFERYVNVMDPKMGVYAPWRDPVLLEEFPGRTEMSDYLNSKGIESFPGGKKRYSTDGNLAGLSHEAEDLESMTTPMTIVEPTMGVWPQDAPDTMETVKIRFEKGLAVEINGTAVTPLQAMLTANEIGGRNGIGMKHALESRVLGTKSRGVYESPGMELLGRALDYVYQAILERRALGIFKHMSKFIADQVYDGRYYDPSTRAAKAAIDVLADYASGTVEVGLYKGNVLFQSQTDCAASLYNEEDSSMEASDGLNPVSSQGYLEVTGVEAIALALAGQIKTD